MRCGLVGAILSASAKEVISSAISTIAVAIVDHHILASFARPFEAANIF